MNGDPDFRDAVRYREQVWLLLGEVKGELKSIAERCLSRKSGCDKRFEAAFEAAQEARNGCIRAQEAASLSERDKGMSRPTDALVGALLSRWLPWALLCVASTLGAIAARYGIILPAPPAAPQAPPAVVGTSSPGTPATP